LLLQDKKAVFIVIKKIDVTIDMLAMGRTILKTQDIRQGDLMTDFYMVTLIDRNYQFDMCLESVNVH